MASTLLLSDATPKGVITKRLISVPIIPPTPQIAADIKMQHINLPNPIECFSSVDLGVFLISNSNIGNAIAYNGIAIIIQLYHGRFTTSAPKIGYPILLHMIINLSTSVVTVFLTQKLDLEAITRMSAMDPTSAEEQAILFQVLPNLLGYVGWLSLLFICVIVGIIMWCCFAKRMFIQPQECQMPKKGRCKAAYLNLGMILYFIFCIALFVFTYASMIATA